MLYSPESAGAGVCTTVTVFHFMFEFVSDLYKSIRIVMPCGADFDCNSLQWMSIADPVMQIGKVVCRSLSFHHSHHLSLSVSYWK